jgi:hypothetical protein
MTDRHVDDAIDGAVREMMEIDPPVGLRARVMSRLEQPAPRTWTWPRMIAIAGVPSAIILAIFLMRGIELEPPEAASTTAKPSQSTQSVGAPPQAGPAAAPAPQVAVVDSGTAPGQKVDRPSRPVARTSRRTTAEPTITAYPLEIAPRIQALAPLEAVAALSLAPLEPRPIAPEALVVSPIEPIADLVLEPLSPRGERD